jgi:glutaredoxin
MNQTLAIGLALGAALAFAAAADGQTMYRYLDPSGHVVYSDQPPPPDARDAQPKQLQGNVIDTDATPFATQQAMQRFPVTLYTFDCDVCRDAQALLDKRGVPHATVIVTEEKGAAKLKALTGGQSAPVLQVGDKEVAVGFNAQRWEAMLDNAGYPADAPPLRTQRSSSAGAAAGPPASASGAPPLGAKAPPTNAPRPVSSAVPAPPAAGTGYPQ